MLRNVRDRMALLPALRAGGAVPVTALTVVLLVDALLPAGYAATLSVLVRGLLAAAQTHGVGAAGWSVAAFGGVLVVTEIVTTLVTPLTLQIGSRVDGANRRTITALTSTCDLATLDRLDVRTLARDAMADRAKGYDATLSDGAVALLRSITSLLGLLAACVVLVGFAWWLPLLVLGPAVLTRIVRTRQDLALMGTWRSATGRESEIDMWRRANLSPAEGKDIRVFGLDAWMVARIRLGIRRANATLWSIIDRMIGQLWRQAVLVVIGLVPAYVVTADAAARGHAGVAVATAVFTGAWAIFQVLGIQTNSYRITAGMRALKAGEELRELLGAPSASARPEAAAPAPRVVFDGVGFSYPGVERPVLADVHLEIRPRELLAVVGVNGAGKTTLMTLLAGLYRPTHGRITVDGVDLARLDPAVWRGRLSVVFQNFTRYPLSLAENVALGAGDTVPDQRLLDAAAQRAGLTELVARLPDGWRTPLHRSRPGGVDLSGGQWQRVVLTRTLYALERGARLLVLDEPTAHLDVAAEFAMFDRLAQCRDDATVVLISHRLSTVRQADRIVVLDGGRVVEQGDHDELMDLGGLYARLFAAQAERFRRHRADAPLAEAGGTQ